LGGLSDGLFPVPYTTALSEMLCKQHQQEDQQTWSLIQPIFSSSYTGFGHGNLDNDVIEIDELVQYIMTYRNCQQKIILIGHSTGCQQIVHYLKYGIQRNKINMAVLQAPVSDREAATIWNHDTSTCWNAEVHIETLNGYIELSRRMKIIEQRGNEMMPRDAFWAPITANRYYDLMSKGGTDDYFSSDYTDIELQNRLSHISELHDTLRHVIVAYSGSDEYVPKHVDTKVLTERLCNAMNYRNNHDNDIATGNLVPIQIAKSLYLPNGNHNLSSNDGTEGTIFVNHIQQLLHTI
jgi:hypothetical protein